MIKLEYKPVASYTKGRSCPHNDALICDCKNCYYCGWNPIVAQKRSERIIAALSKKRGTKNGK